MRSEIFLHSEDSINLQQNLKFIHLQQKRQQKSFLHSEVKCQRLRTCRRVCRVHRPTCLAVSDSTAAAETLRHSSPGSLWTPAAITKPPQHICLSVQHCTHPNVGTVSTVRMSVWLSLAAFLHYSTDPDVTLANGRGCPPPPGCALLDGFQIGAWVSLLWQQTRRTYNTTTLCPIKTWQHICDHSYRKTVLICIIFVQL